MFFEFSPNWKQIIFRWDEGIVKIYDIENKEITWEYDLKWKVYEIVFSPNWKQIIFRWDEGIVKLYELL